MHSFAKRLPREDEILSEGIKKIVFSASYLTQCLSICQINFSKLQVKLGHIFDKILKPILHQS